MSDGHLPLCARFGPPEGGGPDFPKKDDGVERNRMFRPATLIRYVLASAVFAVTLQITTSAADAGYGDVGAESLYLLIGAPR